MRIKHVWSVLCRESIVNQDDNVLSMIGVLEELTVGIKLESKNKLSQIVIPASYEIVSLWMRESKKGTEVAELEYRLIDPEKKELSRTIQKIEFIENINRFRSRIKLQGFPITKSGKYDFEISIKDLDSKKFELVSTLPLDVVLNYEN